MTVRCHPNRLRNVTELPANGSPWKSAIGFVIKPVYLEAPVKHKQLLNNTLHYVPIAVLPPSLAIWSIVSCQLGCVMQASEYINFLTLSGKFPCFIFRLQWILHKRRSHLRWSISESSPKVRWGSWRSGSALKAEDLARICKYLPNPYYKIK